MWDLTPETLAVMLATTIHTHSFSFTDEEELQRGLVEILAEIMPPTSTRREVQLTPKDRIDFMVESVGIEVKIKGSLAALTRQLHRYAQLDAIEALVVVTPVARLAQLPESLNGKPVLVCHLVGSAF
jgi:hypothetical protein